MGDKKKFLPDRFELAFDFQGDPVMVATVDGGCDSLESQIFADEC